MAEGGHPWATADFTFSKVIEVNEEYAVETENVEKEMVDGESISSISDQDSTDLEPEDEVEWCDQDQWPSPFSVKGGKKWHLQLFLSDAGAIPYWRASPFSTYQHEDKEGMLEKIMSKEICTFCQRKS